MAKHGTATSRRHQDNLPINEHIRTTASLYFLYNGSQKVTTKKNSIISKNNQHLELGSAIRIIDNKFNVLFSNQIANSILGDCANEKCHSFDAGNIGKPCIGCPYLELLDGKKLVKQAIIKLPGEAGDAEFICTPVKDSTGKVVGAVEVVQPATQLLKQEQEWKTALDAISAAVCVLDNNARIVKCNFAMSALTGKSSSDLEGASCCRIMHDRESSIPGCPVELMKKTNRMESAELLIDGRWFNITAEPILGKDGKVTGAVHILQDINDKKKAEEELRRSEEKFRNIFDNSSIGKSITSFDGVVNPNKALCDMLGYSKKELSSLNWRDITPEEDIEFTNKYLDKIKSGKEKSVRFTKRYLKKDGSVMWADVSTVLQRDVEGKPLYYITSLVDITERKKAEEALRKSEESLSLALKGSNDGWWDWDLVADALFFSPRWWEMIGYKTDELPPGRVTWEKLTHPDDKDEVARVYLEAIKNCAANFEVESRRRHKNGSWIPVLTRGHVQIDSSGKAVRITGTTTDLTERKKMEEALRSSEEKYRLIFENAKEGIILIDNNGKIIDANRPLLEAAGMDRKELIGRPISNLDSFVKENRDFEKIFQHILLGKDPGRYAWTLKLPDGSERHVISTGSVMSSHGKPVGLAVIIEDITELRNASEELAKSKEFLQNVLNSASEMIISVDQNLMPTAWNPAATKMTGFRKIEVIGRTLSSVKGLELLAGIAQDTLTKGENQLTEVAIRTNYDRQRLLTVSVSLLKDSNARPRGVIMLCRDVTGQLDTTRSISPGNAYILNDREKETLMKSCETFHERGYECIVVTREDPETIIARVPSARVLWLTAAKSEKYLTASDPDQIITWLHKQFSSGGKKAVFIDRTDYLINTHGFDKTLKLVYLLNDHVLKSDNLAFVHVNTEMLTPAQSKILLLELRLFPSTSSKELTLPKKNLELLQFVRSRAFAHTDVYFKDISKNFDVSKVTTKKMINALLAQDFVIVRKIGRLKTVELTDAGKELLSLSRVTSSQKRQ